MEPVIVRGVERNGAIPERGKENPFEVKTGAIRRFREEKEGVAPARG
jgi:hypothetical protein